MIPGVGAARNVTSQCGEDGVLEDAFAALEIERGTCVEVGAWDGKVHSNTYNLIANRGWSGVLIESDRVRFEALQETYRDRPDVTKLNRTVGFTSPDLMDEILAETPLPRNFDLLSLDIDGNDYHVFAAMKMFRPKVVLIEFNPSFPNDFRFVQAADARCSQGSSLLAITELAEEKGYELAGTTLCNGLYVRRELLPVSTRDSLDVLHPDARLQTYVVQLYDGTLLLAGYGDLIWKGGPIDPSCVLTRRDEMVFQPFKCERKRP